MSIYDKASLVHIPSGVKSGTLYNVLPNTADGDFDFTRGSTATRVNKDGLIETVASGVPRLDYPLLDGVVQDCPALLLEPTRKNECLYSKTLSSWSELSGGSLQTITNNDAIAPDGSLTASTITFTGTGISLLRQFTNKAYTSNKHSSSFYAKKISGNGSVFFGITDTETEFTPTDEWVRYEVNNVTPTDFGANLFLDLNFDCTAGDKIAVWGMQLEEGTYSTSVIETSGSAVTRTADAANGAGTSATFNDSEGVLYLDISALGTDSTIRQIAIGNSTNNVKFLYNSSSTAHRAIVKVSGTNVFDFTYTVSDIGFHKVAIKYKQNDFALWVNGIERGTDTNGSTPSGLSEIAFDDGSGGSDFYGKTKELMTFNEALSDSELEDLTSWDSFNEMATEQLYTIE